MLEQIPRRTDGVSRPGRYCALRYILRSLQNGRAAIDKGDQDRVLSQVDRGYRQAHPVNAAPSGWERIKQALTSSYLPNPERKSSWPHSFLCLHRSRVGNSLSCFIVWHIRGISTLPNIFRLTTDKTKRTGGNTRSPDKPETAMGRHFCLPTRSHLRANAPKIQRVLQR